MLKIIKYWPIQSWNLFTHYFWNSHWLMRTMVISDHLESWGDKISHTIYMQHPLSFFVGSQTQFTLQWIRNTKLRFFQQYYTDRSQVNICLWQEHTKYTHADINNLKLYKHNYSNVCLLECPKAEMEIGQWHQKLSSLFSQRFTYKILVTFSHLKKI